MIRKLIAKLKGIDYFYTDLNTEQIALYQKYVNRMLEAVNVNNLTERSLGRMHDKPAVDADYKKIDAILTEAEKDSLEPGYLQVIFEQYIFADAMMREKYKSSWVKTVMKRKSTDFFPDPNAIMHNVFKPEV